MKHLWLLIGLLIGFVLPVSAVEALSEEDFDKIQVFLAETAAVLTKSTPSVKLRSYRATTPTWLIVSLA